MQCSIIVWYVLLRYVVLCYGMACMHACTHARTHACMHACINSCIYSCLHVCMDACMHACMHACMYACMHARLHACMYVFMYVCISIYLSIYPYLCAPPHRLVRRGEPHECRGVAAGLAGRSHATLHDLAKSARNKDDIHCLAAA